MAWIESHQEIGHHPKTGRLARALNITRPAAIGHLHLLWHWALDYAEDGDLSDFEAGEIAEAMMWGGEPSELLKALTAAGFMDRDADTLQIHDWDDYAGRLIEQRMANAEKQRRYRERKRLDREGQYPTDLQDGNVSVTLPSRTRSTVPYSTVQDTTEREASADAEPSPLPLSKTEHLRKHPLPEDFAPDLHQRSAIQEELRLTDAFLDTETANFRDHWSAEGVTKADWQAAWRKWIRGGIEHRREKGGSSPFQAPPAQPFRFQGHREEDEGNPLGDFWKRLEEDPPEEGEGNPLGRLRDEQERRAQEAKHGDQSHGGSIPDNLAV